MYYLGVEYICPGCNRKMDFCRCEFFCNKCKIKYQVPYIYKTNKKEKFLVSNNWTNCFYHNDKLVYKGTFKECCFVFKNKYFA